MRINPKLVYPQAKTSLFIRRDPEATSTWQVINGKWVMTDGKRTGFEVSEVLEKGIALGKLARERAVVLHGEREEMAKLEAEELAIQTA